MKTTTKTALAITVVLFIALGTVLVNSDYLQGRMRGLRLTRPASSRVNTERKVQPQILPRYNESRCYDSDGGEKYLKKGTIYGTINPSDGKTVHTDYCSGSTLIEYSCSGTIAKKTNYECPNGCAAGVCNKEIKIEDGEVVTIEKGKKVKLENNITVEIADIYFSYLGSGGNERAVISTKHFINNYPLDLTAFNHILKPNPEHESLWNEAHGYRVTIHSINEDETVDVSFDSLTSPLDTPQDLYNACMEKYDNHTKCYVESLFEPVNEEIKIETDNFILIGAQEYSDFIGATSESLEFHYEADVEVIGYEKLTEAKVPVRFVKGGSTFVTSDTGIKWLVSNSQKNGAYEMEESQSFGKYVAAHELVHLIIRPNPPISEILNEGLATYIGLQIENYYDFYCVDDGYYKFEESHDFGQLNLYNQIPYGEGGASLYYTSACFWDEYIETEGSEIFQDTMNLIKDYQHIKEKTSFFEIIEEDLSVEMDYYRTKYGFNYTGENGEYGQVGEYYIPFGGSTVTEW